MTELIRPIIDLKHNTIIEFRLSSKQTVISKFQNLTLDGIEYRKDEALEYLEIKSNQQATPIEFIKQGQSVSLQLGQYLTTVDKLTTTFNWTQKKVRYWLAKWQKQGILSCQVVKNKLGHKIGTLITLNKFQEFRNQLGVQYQNHQENQKKLSQNWGSRFCSNNQEKQVFGANKIIKENTYKNNKENLENLLTFEANKKLYDFNSKILQEKREQEKELLILRLSLKKEKTKTNQLKSMSRFKVKGEIKTDKIKCNWDFQDIDDFKKIAERLKMFGFDQYSINRLWWKNSNDIQRLIDYIDYTKMKFNQGKVKDKKKFLYHAINASYDLGELEKMRWEARSAEEKYRIETEKLRIEQDRRAEEERLNTIKNEESRKEYYQVTNWIKNNQLHTIFNEFIKKLESENKFFFGLLCKKARSNGILNVIDYLKSDKTSKMDLCGSGFYFEILELVECSSVLA